MKVSDYMGGPRIGAQLPQAPVRAWSRPVLLRIGTLASVSAGNGPPVPIPGWDKGKCGTIKCGAS